MERTDFMSETTKTRKQGGGIRLGLLAGALLLGSMRGVSVPMGKGYGAAHYGRPKGAKHAGNDNPGGRRRTVRKRPVQPEAHGSFLHWS
ncbi:MAG: hypothetical protein EBV03_04065, partial [Proteobacteria bacterium]|nr:hypothetical protein [Pseudomonadota bacterium]